MYHYLLRYILYIHINYYIASQYLKLIFVHRIVYKRFLIGIFFQYYVNIHHIVSVIDNLHFYFHSNLYESLLNYKC